MPEVHVTKTPITGLAARNVQAAAALTLPGTAKKRPGSMPVDEIVKATQGFLFEPRITAHAPRGL